MLAGVRVHKLERAFGDDAGLQRLPGAQIG